MSNNVSNGKNGEVNTKKIAKRCVSGIKRQSVPVGVKEVIFIPEKSVHLSRLGALFLRTQRW